MLSGLFLNMALVGAEWVLYLLVFTSIGSITIIVERYFFYKEAAKGARTFAEEVRKAVHFQAYEKALQLSKERIDDIKKSDPIDAHVAFAILERKMNGKANQDSDSFFQVGQDAVIRVRASWEKNLSWLATIGSSAPFIGLFGTVLGIIQAFHALSGKMDTGAQILTAGLSDALIATAIGILVAIPAVFAFNVFQRRVEVEVGNAEALQNFLVSHVSQAHKERRE